MKKVVTKQRVKKTNDRSADLYEVIIDLQTEMQAGFARMDTEFAQVNKNFGRVFEDISALQAEVRSIRKYLDRLTEQVNGMRGYSKELDTPYARIAIIEKHIGLKTA